MKVYVDENEQDLIADSFLADNTRLVSEFYHEESELEYGECQLLSLSDYTKQVRKEVCEEIGKKLMKRLNGVVNGNYSDNFINGYSYCSSDIENILDQIQGDKI